MRAFVFANDETVRISIAVTVAVSVVSGQVLNYSDCLTDLHSVKRFRRSSKELLDRVILAHFVL